MYKRTHTCGELRKTQLGETINLNGWVNTVRLHGQVVFVDLRDRYGKTQIVFDADSFSGDFEAVKKLSMEDVLSVKGIVRDRAESAINPNMKTGEIEIAVSDYMMLNEAAPLPFVLSDRGNAEENLRLKYRYLELRMEELQNNMMIRHKTYQAVRGYLSDLDFMEIETPFLMKSTPEGARDYLVPSRIHQGKFYALPQSPQIYKQILMIANYDRYFQIVKCFRDEDLRADRQPEFTQIDIEMSFIDEEDIFEKMEGMTCSVFKSVRNVDLPSTFPRLTWDEAMETYGSDKPDLRYGMELQDVKEFTDVSEFNAFKSAEKVKGIVVNGGAKYSRKNIDGFTDFVKKYKAKGLAWMKGENGALIGGISKFFSEELQQSMCDKLNISDGDILFMIGDESSITLNALGHLRVEIAKREELTDKDIFKPVWITEFPMFEYDKDADRFIAMHHPFTAPREEDLSLIEKDPTNIRSHGYDLVLNGFEIAGGSIRNHNSEIQQRIFKALNIEEKEAKEKFGFLINALKQGAPPHGGIAFGLDRLIAVMAKEDSIRDVIPFPKNKDAKDLMLDSPSEVSEEQLKELKLK